MQGMKKIAIFDQYLTLSRKWYTTEPWLLWNTNRKPYSKAFDWYHFQWSWVTSNPDFKVTPLFDAEYLRNGTRYRHSYNDIHTLYSKVLFRMTLNDLEAKYLTTRSIDRSLCNSWASCTVLISCTICSTFLSTF